MFKFTRNALIALAVVSTAIAPIAAQAGERHGRGERHFKHQGPRHFGGHRNRDISIVAGIAGLAIGAMIADSYAKRHAADDDDGYDDDPSYDRDYYPPAPARNPDVVYAPRHAGAVEPWSRQWYRYCENRYQTFDPQTGTFMGNDGHRHFCNAR